MERKFYKIFRKSIAARLLLLVSLLVGGGDSVWGDETLFDGSTDITGWTKSNIDYSSYSKYLYNNKDTEGTLISDNKIPLSSSLNLVINSTRFTSSSKNQKIIVYYSADKSSWTLAKSFTDILATDTKTDLIVDNIEGTYYIKLECQYIRIYNLSIIGTEAYPKPTGFSCTATTSSTATLNWTAGKDETTWQIKYSTKSTFNPDTEGIEINYDYDDSYSYTLTGLTSGVTYYAYIRSYYSEDDEYSDWSDKIDFTFDGMTLYNNSDENPNFPIKGDKTNDASYNKIQFVIPNADLSTIHNTTISSLVLYAKQSSVSWGDARFDVYLKKRDNSTYTSKAYDSDWGTKVCSNKALSISDNQMVIDFDTPFDYTEGNLMIGLDMITTGTNSSSTWYGQSSSEYIGVYYYFGVSSYNTFKPKVTLKASSHTTSVTLGTTNYTTFACPRALDLANLPSGLKAYKASVTGTTVRFSEVNQAVPANTGVLLEGEAGQSYDIPFADSGSALGDNAFEVNSTGGTFSGDGDYTYFGLIKDSNPLTFGEFNPSSVAIPTNKAYLKVLTSSLSGGAGARQLTYLFDEDETTAIKDLPTAGAKMADDAVFSITGQRVSTPTKGLYIINGKKYIIK